MPAPRPHAGVTLAVGQGTATACTPGFILRDPSLFFRLNTASAIGESLLDPLEVSRVWISEACSRRAPKCRGRQSKVWRAVFFLFFNFPGDYPALRQAGAAGSRKLGRGQEAKREAAATLRGEARRWAAGCPAGGCCSPQPGEGRAPGEAGGDPRAPHSPMQPGSRWGSAGGRQDGAGCAGSRCGDPALRAAPHGGCSIAVPPTTHSGHRGPVPGAGGGLSPRQPQPRPAPPPGRAEPSGAAPSRAQAAGSGHHAPTVSSGAGMGVPGGGPAEGPWVTPGSLLPPQVSPAVAAAARALCPAAPRRFSGAR